MSTTPKNNSICIDFEFNRTKHKDVQLVCAVTEEIHTGKIFRWWLHKDKTEQARLKKYLSSFETVLSFAAEAEARSYYALTLDPLKVQWIDLHKEYRCLTNHNDRLMYGKQLVDGKVKMTFKPKPKWEREKGEKSTGFSPTHSLAECTYKLMNKIRDTEHKTKMRDLIISDPEHFTKEEREWILDYCEEDVVDLKPLWHLMVKEYRALLGSKFDMAQLVEDAKLRGRYAVHTARMERIGYPLDVEKTKNFSDQVGTIIYELQKEINKLFPEIKPFRWNKRENRFSENQRNIKDWIENESGFHQTWPRTETRQYSLSLESFEKFYQFKHDYPKESFGAQMVRYGKLKQSIYGFSRNKSSDRKTLWDYLGPDGRVRPYMNIYKAQSSRSQPAATGFMFLKPAWMRALVQPDKGKFIASIDYGSQEFFLSAIMSGDQNMIDAYLSGDPYLAFGKLSRQIPKDGTKEKYKFQRDMCKSTVLGISYLMTKYGLAIKLSNDTGKPWSEEEAQEQIDLFYEAFWRLQEWQEECIESYESGIPIRLPDGWYLWNGNDNFRSSTNARIQGLGAVIMRKAVDLAVEKGVDVIFTLHDALYIEGNVGEEYKIKILAECMREAFVFYLPEKYKQVGTKIKLDPFAWSPDYAKDMEIEVDGLVIPASNLYIDERAAIDYQKFSKYFNKPKTANF